jgi:phosphate transport system substrate-binding protein
MDWLSTENIVALVTAILGIVASFAVVWYERRVPQRMRIGYRVQMDMPIGSENGGAPGRQNIRLGLFDELPDMSDATLVLLRIENDGALSLEDTDYTGRDTHGLTAVFTDRIVRGVAVTEPTVDHLMDHFTPARGMRYSENVIYLPRVPLNTRQHYKVLVLLTGGGVGRAVRVSGGLRGGAVVPNRSTTVDDKPPLFSRPARLITVLLTVCVTVLACIIVWGQNPPPPVGCARGDLGVRGSTAFENVLLDVRRRYQSDCSGSHVDVAMQGSNEGLQELQDAGRSATGVPAMITVYDGAASNIDAKAKGSRIAVSAFAVVVNNAISTTNLTTDQLRRIFRGDIVNWAELGGPNLPISLVSRNADSGTRDLFRRRVLGGAGEPAFTSRDCVHKNSPSDPVIRCELDSTEHVLSTVAQLPGAIGYSELRTAAGVRGLHTVSIDGQVPSIKVGNGTAYPFVEIEYAYTYGQPPADSLVASFLTYLTRGLGQAVIEAAGDLPCYSPEGFARCQDQP